MEEKERGRERIDGVIEIMPKKEVSERGGKVVNRLVEMGTEREVGERKRGRKKIDGEVEIGAKTYFFDVRGERGEGLVVFRSERKKEKRGKVWERGVEIFGKGEVFEGGKGGKGTVEFRAKREVGEREGEEGDWFVEFRTESEVSERRKNGGKAAVV